MSSIATSGRRALWSTALTTVIFISLDATAQAVPVRYEFGGSLVFADPSTAVGPGTRFTGSFVYDPAEGTISAAVFQQTEFLFGQTSSLSVQVAGQPVYSSQGNLGMGIATFWPETILVLRQPDNQDGISPFLEFRNIGGHLVIFPSLPPTSLSLSDFPYTGFFLSPNPGGQTLYQGTIDTLIAVPEPGMTTIILLLAAGCICRRSLCRSQRSH